MATENTIAKKLPFQITVEWTEGSTLEEQTAAQPWIEAGMNAVNEEPDDMPACIKSVEVSRT